MSTSTGGGRVLRDRMLGLAHEVMKFGIVGAVGFVIDVSVFNLLRYGGNPGILEHKPLTAKAISVAVATVFTYLGNRHWTWENRERSGVHREMALFFALNGVALLISVACLAFTHYVLDLRSPLADNISANVIGLALGMMFRFWSYRTFVFRHPEWREVGWPEDEAIEQPDRGDEERSVTAPR